jgi:hypothetical protein
MMLKTDYIKIKTGKSLEEKEAEIPTAEQIIHQKLTRIKSKYDLRVISPALFFSEEQRPHTHVIGATQQGKSFFLEWLMREDINRGLGCCLLDPSSGGSTAQRLLSYCAEKGKQNVLYIDVDDSFAPLKKMVGLNPFRYDKDGKPSPKRRYNSVDVLMRAVRDLYGVKDPGEQAVIERYLPSVFYALYDSQSPLVDARYFANRLYKPQQDEILSFADTGTRLELKEALGSFTGYKEFQSTVRRLLRFTRGPIGQMFSVDKGVDWVKVVRDKWAVIVRLDNLDTFDARLLGTYIIAQIEYAKQYLNNAIDRNRDLNQKGKYPPFYLYADEAQLFASESLKNLLNLKQKLNLKLIIAHHYTKQFNPDVYEAVKVNCGITVQFYIRGRETRDDIAAEMYGGDIDPKDASYANSNLAQRQAVIKISKGSPQRTMLPFVPDPDISRQELTNYKVDLYHRLTEMNWYHDADKIIQPIYEPRPEERPHKTTPRPRAKDDSKANRPRRVPHGEDYAAKLKTISFDLPEREQHAPKDGKKKRNKDVGD